MRIRTKALIVALSVVLLTGITATVAGREVSRRAIGQSIRSHLTDTAVSRAHAVETFVDSRLKAVLQLSESVVIERLLISSKMDEEYEDALSDATTRLRNTVSTNDDIRDIFVLDTNGMVVASSTEERIGLDRSGDPLFVNGKEGAYVKGPYFSEFPEGQSSLAVSAPVLRDATDDLLGVVVIRSATDPLNDITTCGVGTGETGEAYLVNSDGYMISPSKFVDDAFLTQRIDTPAFRECWQLLGEEKRAQEQEVNVYQSYWGDTVLGTHCRVRGTDWCLLAEVSEEEAFSPIARLTRTMLLTLAGFICVGSVLCILLSRTVTRPIVELHRGVKEVATGNLDHRVGMSARDEIGELSRAFDAMVADLKESRAQLDEYNRSLEETVEARTRELAEAVEESDQQRIAALNAVRDLEQANERLGAEITERKRAEEKTQRQAAQAALIYDVGRRVSSELELAPLLSETVTAVRDAFDYYGVMLLLLDEEGKHLTLQSIAGAYAGIFPEDLQLAIGEGMIGHAAATGITQISGDVSQDPHYVRKATEATVSELAAPIKIGQGVIGVFDLQSDELDAFDDTDVVLMETLADQLGAAIENARLYETVQRELAQREQTEQALRDSEERLRTLLHSTPSGAVLIDAETHTIVDANPAALAMIAAPREQVIGSVCHKHICPAEKGRCPITDLGQTADNSERVLLTAAGESVPIIKTVASVVLDGRRHLLESFTDISERKRMEEALQRERDLAESLVETAQTIVLVLDPEGRIVRFNPYMEEISGYRLAEVQGKDWFSTFLPQRDQARIREVFSRAIGDTQTRGDVNPIITKDGRERLIEWYDKTLKDAEGHVTGLLAIGQDITDRVQAKNKLKESEEKFRTFMETASDLMLIADKDRNITYLNDSTARTLGYTRQEMIGMHITQLISRNALKEDFKPNWGEFLAKGEITLETTLAAKDGRDVAAELKAVAVHDSDGKYAGSRTVFRDISERKRAEEELRTLKDFNEGIVRTVAEALLIEDAEGIITFVNPAMEKMLGYTADELIGSHWRKIVPQSELELVQSRTSQRPAGVGDRYESRLRSKDGREMPVLISACPLFEEGTFRGALSAFTDITDRKHAEEQLQHYAAELQQANEEVKSFAYIVSHDLRAPLVNLKGFSRELRDSLKVIGPAIDTALPHLDETQRQAVTIAFQQDAPEAMDFIESSATHMDHFINALLKLGRLGRREIRPEPLDMNVLVQEALHPLTHQLEEHRTQVTVEPLPGVVADRTSMEQIVGNILGNATKYLDDTRPGEIVITAEQRGGETTFHIRDNGRGIAESDMPKVFAPFRRAGKQDVPGEGMGLTYVQTLIRRHGGRTWCESELGVGTTFSFTIPNDSANGGDNA